MSGSLSLWNDLCINGAKGPRGHTSKKAQWDLDLKVSQEGGFLLRLQLTAKV